MQQRQIPPSAVFDAVRNGELIEERDEEGEIVYLLLGSPEGRAIHVAVVREGELCKVKTVYEPDPAEWTAGYRRRR
jgi:hypothetical protein